MEMSCYDLEILSLFRISNYSSTSKILTLCEFLALKEEGIFECIFWNIIWSWNLER